MKTWKPCPHRRCENGAVFERSLMRFVSCERCGGRGMVHEEPGFFDAMTKEDLIFPILCTILILIIWRYLA